MRATGCCSAQPLLMASWADSSGSAACRLPSGMGWMWANSRPIMNASFGPVGRSSRSHKARAPGTEMALGRSSTPGRAKTLWASSSTSSRSGFCGRSYSEHSWPVLTTSSVVLHQPHYGRVQTSVARHYLSAIEIQHAAPVVCQLPTSLLENYTSRGEIPRPDTPLVVSVYPPRSHVAQIKRRRTEATHASGGRREASKELQGFGHLSAIVGEAGRDKRSDQLVGVRHFDRLAVQGGASALLGDEGFLAYRVVYHPQHHRA